MKKEKSVSIIKEIRDGDLRVILQPNEVKLFCNSGFKVYVERDAGLGVGCTDNAYKAAGASIVSTDDAWSVSDYVIKCRCPSEDEWRYFRPGLNLGATFYAGDKEPLVQCLLDNSVNAFSYELFKTQNDIFPLMTTDSEISGHMAIIYGGYHLQNQMGGSGVMLGGINGSYCSKVLVIGYGNAGGAAARAAAALGASVVVLGSDPAKLRKFQAGMPPNVSCYINSREVLERELPDTDLVVGAILISNYDTKPMIDNSLLKKMKPGSVIVDVTCGYGGGYLPTAHSKTRLLEDVYRVENIIHFKNDCMPKLVHITAAKASSSNAAPYLINLGNSIFDDKKQDPVSTAGQVTCNGKLIHNHIIKELESKRKWFESKK